FPPKYHVSKCKQQNWLLGRNRHPPLSNRSQRPNGVFNLWVIGRRSRRWRLTVSFRRNTRQFLEVMNRSSLAPRPSRALRRSGAGSASRPPVARQPRRCARDYAQPAKTVLSSITEGESLLPFVRVAETNIRDKVPPCALFSGRAPYGAEICDCRRRKDRRNSPM